MTVVSVNMYLIEKYSSFSSCTLATKAIAITWQLTRYLFLHTLGWILFYSLLSQSRIQVHGDKQKRMNESQPTASSLPFLRHPFPAVFGLESLPNHSPATYTSHGRKSGFVVTYRTKRQAMQTLILALSQTSRSWFITAWQPMSLLTPFRGEYKVLPFQLGSILYMCKWPLRLWGIRLSLWNLGRSQRPKFSNVTSNFGCLDFWMNRQIYSLSPVINLGFCIVPFTVVTEH